MRRQVVGGVTSAVSVRDLVTMSASLSGLVGPPRGPATSMVCRRPERVVMVTRARVRFSRVALRAKDAGALSESFFDG
ncbi:hypothetical protein GCM10023259_095930 [Thermocatellispora tengchongensis]